VGGAALPLRGGADQLPRRDGGHGALSDVSDSLKATLTDIHWILDSYLLALASLVLLCSGLADRYGRKKIYLSGLGIALGPVLSGGLLTAFDWQVIFWINIPVVALALIGIGMLVGESREPGDVWLAVRGALSSLLALGGMVFALLEGDVLGWSNPRIVSAFILGAVGHPRGGRSSSGRSAPDSSSRGNCTLRSRCSTSES
jgi:MFS family permease